MWTNVLWNWSPSYVNLHGRLHVENPAEFFFFFFFSLTAAGKQLMCIVATFWTFCLKLLYRLKKMNLALYATHTPLKSFLNNRLLFINVYNSTFKCWRNVILFPLYFLAFCDTRYLYLLNRLSFLCHTNEVPNGNMSANKLSAKKLGFEVLWCIIELQIIYN